MNSPTYDYDSDSDLTLFLSLGVDLSFLPFLSFIRRTNASLAITALTLSLSIVKYCVFVHYGSIHTNEKMATIQRYQFRCDMRNVHLVCPSVRQRMARAVSCGRQQARRNQVGYKPRTLITTIVLKTRAVILVVPKF